jgi:hypothetical protein
MLDNAALKDLLAKKMVTPAAKRDAVAHLRSAFDTSERRACRTLECVRMTCDTVAVGMMMLNCGNGCGRWRMSVAASVIGACMSCCRERAFMANHKRLFRPTGRNGSRCADAQDAGLGHTGTDTGAAASEGSLVARLRRRPVHRRPPHTYPRGGRRRPCGSKFQPEPHREPYATCYCCSNGSRGTSAVVRTPVTLSLVAGSGPRPCAKAASSTRRPCSSPGRP